MTTITSAGGKFPALMSAVRQQREIRGKSRLTDWRRRQASAAAGGSIGLADDLHNLVLLHQRLQRRQAELAAAAEDDAKGCHASSHSLDRLQVETAIVGFVHDSWNERLEVACAKSHPTSHFTSRASFGISPPVPSAAAIGDFGDGAHSIGQQNPVQMVRFVLPDAGNITVGGMIDRVAGQILGLNPQRSARTTLTRSSGMLRHPSSPSSSPSASLRTGFT